MFNICYSFWNPTKNNITKHTNFWRSLSDHIRKNIQIIIVDDCSEKPVKFDIDFKLNLKVARITDEIYWNICGAKNLVMTLASHDWTFISDQDHIFSSEQDLFDAINYTKIRNSAYFLNRLNPDGTNRGKRHPNSFIIHQEDFWKLGGYDEDFSGHRGFSDHMIHQQMKKFNISVQNLPISITEYKEFTCIDPQNRNFAYNSSLVNKKMTELINNKYENGPVLRFDWKIAQKLKYNA